MLTIGDGLQTCWCTHLLFHGFIRSVLQIPGAHIGKIGKIEDEFCNRSVLDEWNEDNDNCWGKIFKSETAVLACCALAVCCFFYLFYFLLSFSLYRRLGGTIERRVNHQTMDDDRRHRHHSCGSRCFTILYATERDKRVLFHCCKDFTASRCAGDFLPRCFIKHQATVCVCRVQNCGEECRTRNSFNSALKFCPSIQPSEFRLAMGVEEGRKRGFYCTNETLVFAFIIR